MIAEARRIARLVLCGALLAACASSSTSVVRAGSAYETVMRWFADEDTADREPLQVFIEPRGEGTSIDLEVQANVIEHSADYADARFIDTRDEALIVDEEGVAAVRDEGILIRIGPVVEEGDTVSLDVDQFVDSETQRSLRFELVAVDGEWRMRGEPTVVDPA